MGTLVEQRCARRQLPTGAILAPPYGILSAELSRGVSQLHSSQPWGSVPGYSRIFFGGLWGSHRSASVRWPRTGCLVSARGEQRTDVSYFARKRRSQPSLDLQTPRENPLSVLTGRELSLDSSMAANSPRGRSAPPCAGVSLCRGSTHSVAGKSC